MTFAYGSDERGTQYEIEQDGELCNLMLIFGQQRVFIARASLNLILVLTNHLGIKWDIKY